MTADLSYAERRVVALLGTGMTNRQIAVELCVSENTVKTHVRSVLRKLGAQDRAHVVGLVAEQRRREAVARSLAPFRRLADSDRLSPVAEAEVRRCLREAEKAS